MNAFPDTMKIKITNSDTGKPVPNIAVQIKLFADRKNDYYFISPISDYCGSIIVSKDWLNKQIEIERKFFIMDYSSTLEHCYPRIEFKILNSEDLKRVVKAMDHYKEALNTQQQDIDNLSKVDNYKYMQTSKLVELHGDKIVEFEINIKEAK